MEANQSTDRQAPQRITFGQIVVLQLAMLLFSGVNALIKLAGQYPLLSWNCILLFGAGLCLMGVYAIVWQQLLKRVPLITAYCNRATVMLFSVVWGIVLFSETITWNMVVGGLIILAGIYVVVTADA